MQHYANIAQIREDHASHLFWLKQMYGRRLIPETLREDIDSQKIMEYIDSPDFKNGCVIDYNESNHPILKWLKSFYFNYQCIDPNFKSKKLGEGGFGVVRTRQLSAPKTENVSIKFQVAMKEGKPLSDGDIKKWRTCWKEACILLYVSGHPNILQCYGFSKKPAVEPGESILLIATELATHGSLSDVLKRIGSNHDNPKIILTSSLAINMMWIEQLLQGLVHIHKLGIKHRDLKPGNLLIFNGLVLKISDFGSGRNEIAYADQNSTTHIGTNGYIAPEVVFGKPSTNATDMWSFAIVVYELFHPTASIQSTTFEEVREGKDSVFNDLKNSSLEPDIKNMLMDMMRAGFQYDKENSVTFGRDTSAQALEKFNNWLDSKTINACDMNRELIMKNLKHDIVEMEKLFLVPPNPM